MHKFISNPFLLGVIFATLLLGSCKKKKDDEPSPSSNPNSSVNAPKLEFIKKSGSVTADTTITPGKSATIVYKIDKGNSDIKTIKVNIDGKPSGVWDYFDDLTLFALEYPLTDSIKVNSTKSTTGTKEVTFEVTAINGETTKKSINVTFFDPISSTTSVDIISLNDSSSNSAIYYKVGGFYSLSKRPLNIGYTYLESEASSVKQLIDFCYVYDSNKDYLVSPSDAMAQSVYPSVKNWSVKNTTKFVATNLTIDQYKNATGDQIVQYAKDAGIESGAAKTEIKKNGSTVVIYAMKTSGGKYALINPYSLSSGYQGIAIEIKKVK